MEYQQYQGSLAHFKKMNRYLTIVLLAMAVALVGMSIAVYRAIGHKSVVLMPPVLTQQMTISDVMPDAAYLQQMGLFLVSLRLNITPSNIDNHFKTFLTHVNSSIYGQVSVELDEEIKAVQRGRITSAFYPREQLINPHDLSVKITGRLDKYVGNRQISSKDQTYLLTFDYNQGHLSIIDYYRLESNQDKATKK
ncbi:type IV conjugative transfer system protein TraE [Fastidiosibacter lacustris]|uniref:type IV conjugative transfer system protein TraE n=1 Tax=Fastidiosibacter lacustris TaxID=2056695 RepID=UPI000E355A9E|nr:type IV conjugative transfer system protein TraE [Fastidiosibacter lacustris]